MMTGVVDTDNGQIQFASERGAVEVVLSEFDGMNWEPTVLKGTIESYNRGLVLVIELPNGNRYQGRTVKSKRAAIVGGLKDMMGYML